MSNADIENDPRSLRLASVVARTTAAFVAAMGVLVLVGWMLDVELLKSLLHPGKIAMNPATAVAFILSAVALWCLLPDGASTARRRLGLAAAAVTLVIGLLRLVGFHQAFNLHVDEWLFPARVGTNVMAPNTALAFVLTGAALLLLDARSHAASFFGQACTLLAAGIALLSLTGYYFRTVSLYQVTRYIPMALNTALAFAALALGILCARPKREPVATVIGDTAGGLLARRLLPVAIAGPLLLGWMRLKGERLDLYDGDFGVALFAVTTILVFVVVVWWTARMLRRLDVERAAARVELAASEERHRAVVQQAADGITLVDGETLHILEVNQAFARLLGYTHDELVGRPISELIVDTAEGVAARAQQTLGTDGPAVVQRQYRRKDGSVVDTEKSATVLTLGGRRVLCTVIHDITERKRAQEAFDAERTLLRTVIDNLPDRIYVKDLDGRYVLDNAAHQRQLGIDRPEQIIGKTTRDFFPKEVAEKFEQDDQSVLRSAKPLFDREELSSDRAGRDRWLQTTKVPLTDGQQKLVGLVGMSRDITDRKRAQQLIEEKHSALEQAMESERQAHEQLKAAQSQLVQTEKLAGLGQMVAGVAHEINNPLSFVSNNVAVLERDSKALVELLRLYAGADPTIAERQPELAAEIKDLAERVDLAYTLENLKELMSRSREGLRRIQQIVKDLRDFARLDQGDQHEVDLNAGIESTVNIILGRAKKKRVEIVKELGPLPTLTCHAAKLNQVIMNLLANAIDASNEGGKVTIRTSAQNGSLQVAVADTGSGIDPALRARIFDPFFTTKPIGEGTGLGLSISYGIVQEHGGRIDVDSEPGKGSTFTIVLPLHSRPEQKSH